MSIDEAVHELPADLVHVTFVKHGWVTLVFAYFPHRVYFSYFANYHGHRTTSCRAGALSPN